MLAWAVRVRRRLLDVMKPLSSGVERAVAENDEATSRGSAEATGSRAVTSVGTALGGVAIAEAETVGGVKRMAVLQGGKPPREALETMSRSTTMTRCQATMEASDVLG